MTAASDFVGKLSIPDDKAMVWAKTRLKNVLVLGGVDKYEIARTLGAVSELMRAALRSVDTSMELALSVAGHEPACYVDILFLDDRFHADDVLTRYFEVSEDNRRLQYRRRVSLASIDAEFRAHALEIMEEKSEEQVKQLVLDKEAAEAAKLAQFHFMRKVSHELRTPLNVIKGYSEMVMEEAEEPRTREDLSHILDASGQLLNIINNVLDFSSSEMGQIKTNEESVSSEGLVQEVVSELTELIGSRDNKFNVAYSDSLPTLVTDKEKLHYILKHLLTNASKFTRHGEISLRVYEERKYDTDGVLFVVEDTGQGIDKGHLPRLFEPFTQLAPAGTGESGLGIGLALCLRYSKVLGGSLEAESSPEKGSVFTLWLPLTAS